MEYAGRYLPGTEIGGYTIGGWLGEGGSAQTYRAIDAEGMPVCFKLIGEAARDETVRVRIEREIEILKRLNNPRVARIVDAEIEGNELFIVTELIEGVDLEKWVSLNGPLAGHGLYDLALKLHTAISEIHKVGILHRDIKPANILMSPNGPVIIDFGIAQNLQDPRLTMHGFVMGTPGYLAPELIDRKDPSMESDWWSWAAVLVFAASGRPPFGSGSNAEVIARVKTGEVDVSGLGDNVSGILKAALNCEVSERPAAALVLQELYVASFETPPAVALRVRPTTALNPSELPIPSPAEVVPEGPSGTKENPQDSQAVTAEDDAVAAEMVSQKPMRPPFLPRKGVIFLGAVVFFSFGLAMPLVCLFVISLFMGVFRVVDNLQVEITRRQEVYGQNANNRLWSVFMGPVVALRALVQGIPAGFVAWLTLGVVGLLGYLVVPESLFNYLTAVIVLTMLALFWGGSLNNSARRGARTLVNRVITTEGRFLGFFMVVIFVSLISISFVIFDGTNWFPLQQAPSLRP